MGGGETWLSEVATRLWNNLLKNIPLTPFLCSFWYQAYLKKVSNYDSSCFNDRTAVLFLKHQNVNFSHNCILDIVMSVSGQQEPLPPVLLAVWCGV